MRINSYKSADEQLTGRNATSRKIANHTYLHRIDENTIAIRLHSTDIVTYHSDGRIVLNSGGWRTVTTKARMNEFSPVNISQTAGNWFVAEPWNGNNSQSRWDNAKPYADGFTILPDGTFDPATFGNDPAETKKTLRRIKKYCDAYMVAFMAGNVPKPSAGDCFYCVMREVKTKRPLGEITKDHSHLDSHIEESYFVPSLLARAIERFPVAPVAMWTISDKWAGTSNNAMVDIAREQLHKSLYRYMKEQYGIAA